MPNPLNPVIDWYRTALDALRVTFRVLDLGIAKAVTTRHKTLHGSPPKDAKNRVKEAEIGLDRLTTLELTAVFERVVRIHLAQTAETWLPAVDPFQDEFRNAVLTDVERWDFKGRLIDVFGADDVQLRGDVKQVVDFRNWVANGWHAQKPAPSNVTAEEAYRRLTAFLAAIGVKLT